jgi:D-alanyl-D-alanine carboxypeptidase (penicillin-binding protein 5/6)
VEVSARSVVAALLLVFATAVGTVHAETTAPTDTTTVPPFSTPNTDKCPNRNDPPPPIDKSEVPRPGAAEPVALPIPTEPVGGELLGRCGIITPAGAPPLPEKIGATSWLVADMDTGEVLAAKDPHGRYRPASTLKVLLAIVALRELSLGTVVTGKDEDADMEGSRVGIGAGGRYSNLELMQALMMVSGNDAANALARQLGGTDQALRLMNETAQELGALDTRAATVCGLDGPGMATSAYDLAVFFREAMEDPDFARIVRTEQAQFPGFPAPPGAPKEEARPGFAIGNDNLLLYNYPGAIGGKTGFTDDANHTYVGAAERFGRRLVVTILDSSATYMQPWEQGARLLDYGFALKSQAIGSLDNEGFVETDAAITTSRPAPAATLAAPPPKSSQSIETVSTSNQPAMIRFAIGLLGGLVVCLLVLAAMSMKRRR